MAQMISDHALETDPVTDAPATCGGMFTCCAAEIVSM